MKDEMFCFDGPAQFLNEDAKDAIRRAQSEVDEAFTELSRAAVGMAQLFDFPITRDRVTHWLDTGPGARKAAFGNTLWATISWEKSLGRPKSPRLADAFRYHHFYGWLDTAATRGEPIGDPVWEPLPAPRAWDGQEAGERYRVNVLVRAIPGLHNRFWPALRNDVQWEGAPSLSFLQRVVIWPAQMIPHGQFFLYENDALVPEDEYQVVSDF
jgi:hypothetical protein